MNDNDLRNISDGDYLRLMAEAYPLPKKNIRDAVMAEITAEAKQTGRKAKILSPKQRNLFVKFGSMAACLVLLVTLGFRVLPMMTKDAVTESAADMAMAPMEMVTVNTSSYADEDAVPETEEESGSSNAGIKYKSSSAGGIAEEPAADFAVLTDAVPEEAIAEEPAEEEVEAEAAVNEAAPAAEVPMLMTAPAPTTEEAAAEDAADTFAVPEAIVEECAKEEVVEECAAEEAVVEEAAPQSGISSFESELKLALTGEIDTETYTAWLTAHGYVSAEDWTVEEFVSDHGISRERFTELYDALTAFILQTDPEAEIVSYNLDELYPN